MILPLFAIAFFVDKTGIVARLQALRKVLHYRLFGQTVTVNLSQLLSGIMFLIISLFILVFERTSDPGGSIYQCKVNLITAQVTQTVSRVTQSVPEWVWAVFFIGLVSLIVRLAWKQAHKPEAKS
jgi:hypothetical protein